MQVDDLPVKRRQKAGLEHPHETGEHHEISLRGSDGGDEALLALAFELGLERRRIDELRGHAEPRPERENAGSGLVGENRNHARAPELPSLLGSEDGLGVAAATGTKNDDAHSERRH